MNGSIAHCILYTLTGRQKKVKHRKAHSTLAQKTKARIGMGALMYTFIIINVSGTKRMHLIT